MNANENSFAARDTSMARDFTRHLTELLRKEQGAMVSFLLALAECDGRRLWADLGYASLFDYLHGELKLSRSAAYYRTAAAGLVQRYPEVADALADGRLCLTSLAEVGKVITVENAAEILPRFFHLSSREAKEVVVELAPMACPPRRQVVTSVRPLVRDASASTPRLATAAQPAEVRPCAWTRDFDQAAELASTPVAEPAASKRPGGDVQVEPLTANLRRIHFTVTKRWMEKLDAAKAALSHSIPSGSAEEVIEAAFDALLEREAKRKGLLVKKPRAPKAAAQPAAQPEAQLASQPAEQIAKHHRKAVPAHVRREVIARDGGRCQAKLHDGTICGSKVRLQLDHVRPASLDGPSTVENVRVLCARHNQLAARKVFGESLMELFAARRA